MSGPEGVVTNGAKGFEGCRGSGTRKFLKMKRGHNSHRDTAIASGIEAEIHF